MANCYYSWIADVKQTPYGTLSQWVPCGKCEACRRKKRRLWASRCSAEAHTSDVTLFVTLTYKQTDNIERYEYVQKFFKRLRKKGYKFSYFGCTEYGDSFGRLHHHILFFLRETFFLDWPSACNVVRSDFESCWPHGFVQVLIANIKTINYCTGYVDKKLLDENRRAHNFMSLKNPIGYDYAKKGLDFLRANGYDVFDGQKVAIARCFKERFDIKKSVRELYNEQEERDVYIDAFEQRTGKSYQRHVDELACVDKSLQFRREAQRRAKGCRVSQIMRKHGQLSRVCEDGSSANEEGGC